MVNGTSSSAISASWTSGGGSTAGFIVNIAQGDIPSLSCAGGSSVGLNLSASFSSLLSNAQYTVAICSYNSAAVQSDSVVAMGTTLVRTRASDRYLLGG